jgi:hypothetical protein
MALKLMVKRVEFPPGISVMLWTSDRDARLLEWKDFHAEGALGVWLAGIVGKYGRAEVKLEWTEQLKADARLAPLLSSILGPPER